MIDKLQPNLPLPIRLEGITVVKERIKKLSYEIEDYSHSIKRAVGIGY